jgi:AcrR family transcriptional regulator
MVNESSNAGVQHSDPRAVRTRSHLLEQARALAAEQGAGAVTYSALAARAGVARPTIYRHWPRPEMLLRDMVLEIPYVEHKLPSGEVRTEIVDYLRRFLKSLDDPATASVLTALLAQAGHDPLAGQALKNVFASSAREMNELLAGTGMSVKQVDVSMLIGPLFFHRFVQQTPTSSRFITEVVDLWLRGRDGRTNDAAAPKLRRDRR